MSYRQQQLNFIDNNEKKVVITIVVNNETQKWRFVIDYENWHDIGDDLIQSVFKETNRQFMNMWRDSKHWLNRIED